MAEPKSNVDAPQQARGRALPGQSQAQTPPATPIPINEDLQRVLRSISDYLWSGQIDRGQFTYRYYSPVVEQITGRPPEFYLPSPERWLSTIHPEDQKHLRTVMQRLITGASIHEEEQYRLVRPDGTIRWVRDSVIARRQRDGSTRLDGVVTDITERRLVEEALRESEAKYRSIFEHSPAVVVLVGADGIILEVNSKASDRLGYDARELVGRHFMQLPLWESKTKSRMKRLFTSRLNGASVEPYDLEFVQADGERLVMHVHGTVLRDERGTPTRVLFLASDVTQQRRAEEALRESEQRLRTLVEYAPEAIVILDAKSSRFVDANVHAQRLYGFDRDALLRLGPIELSPDTQPDGRASHEAAHARINETLDGGTPTFEWVHRNAAGNLVPCEVRLVRMPAAGRSLIRGSITDITDRKQAEAEREQLEQQLRQSQKMEALGQLAGGVAHDFNNILTTILGNSDLLLDLLPADPAPLSAEAELRRGLEQIKLAGKRAASFTRELLTFSRKGLTTSEVLDINQIISGMEQMLRRLIGEHIELIAEYTPRPVHVRGNAGQFVQVIMNLVVNARDAMPQGGRITIRTAILELTEAHVKVHLDARPGRHVMIEIKDSGIGMSREHVDHMFDPFFTTKTGKGTGMGLSTVYGIIKRAGGHLTVDSAPGRGTTVRAHVPLVDEPVPSSDEPPAAARRPPSPEHIRKACEAILICEDDADVLQLAHRTLGAKGYEVLTAADGEEALQIAARHGRPIQLLLTDVVMPKMNGRELAENLRRRHDGLRVLFVSGYSANVLAPYGVIEGGVDFLEKPFAPAELVARVQMVLHGAVHGAASQGAV